MPATLTVRALNRALLARQHLLDRTDNDTVNVVERVGGLQSQESRDAYIGLWTRIRDFDEQTLVDATLERRIVRGTSLRGTIHTESAAVFAAHRGVLQEIVDRIAHGRANRYTGIDEVAAARTVRRVLRDDRPRTARELGEALAPNHPGASLEGLAFFARMQVPLVMAPRAERWGFARPPRFLLAERWLGTRIATPCAAAKVDLVRRGIAAIGPCSAADLRTWSGLSGIAAALATLRDELVEYRDEQGRTLVDLPDAPRPDPGAPAPARFFGEFDNVFLSHADRARVVDPTLARAVAASRNGRRDLVFTVDGFVSGRWTTASDRSSARVEVIPFRRLSRVERRDTEREAESLVRFLAPDAPRHEVVTRSEESA